MHGRQVRTRSEDQAQVLELHHALKRLAAIHQLLSSGYWQDSPTQQPFRLFDTNGQPISLAKTSGRIMLMLNYKLVGIKENNVIGKQ